MSNFPQQDNDIFPFTLSLSYVLSRIIHDNDTLRKRERYRLEFHSATLELELERIIIISFEDISSVSVSVFENKRIKKGQKR